MIRPCLSCKENYFIYDKNKWLCEDCSKKQKEEKAMKMSGSKDIKNLADLFLEIWGERSHYCEECNLYLGEEPKPIFFSHTKSRGAYPELKYDKNEIKLLCGDCHYQHDFGDKNKKRNG